MFETVINLRLHAQWRPGMATTFLIAVMNAAMQSPGIINVCAARHERWITAGIWQPIRPGRPSMSAVTLTAPPRPAGGDGADPGGLWRRNELRVWAHLIQNVTLATK